MIAYFDVSVYFGESSLANKGFANTVFSCNFAKNTAGIITVSTYDMYPPLLTWINFNSSMVK